MAKANSLPLLPTDALKGVRVGISVSDSVDLGRLGLTEGHFRLALGEIARCVLVLGGSLAYGGHLDPSGYTVFLASELRRYARRDRPLLICLPWSEHRKRLLSALQQEAAGLGLYGSIVCLDEAGNQITPDDGRGEVPVPETDDAKVSAGLTSLRRYMIGACQGRVLLGGKRHGFQGVMPGLVEEATLALEAQQPLFLAGGYGGVTLDMLQTIEPGLAAWLPLYTPVQAPDPRTEAGLAVLAKLADGKGWQAFNNGLTADECRQLAATHRPSEIATLVSLGLGRRFLKP